MTAFKTLKRMEDFHEPKNDKQDAGAILKIGGSPKKTIKKLAAWQGEGKLLVDIAVEKQITPQALSDYWEKHTTAEFRERTRHTQAEAFWVKGTAIIEKVANDRKSTASSRSRAKMKADVCFNTAKRLHPEKWDQSVANKIARKKIDKSDKPDDSIPYGVEQDLGNPNDYSHVIALQGGVKEDFVPKYDDAFEDEVLPRNYLISRITSSRPCPFDKINWKKIMPAYVKQVDTEEAL